MSVRDLARKIIRKPLNALGLDLVRYNPRARMGDFIPLAAYNINTVIDVGAHKGEFARMMRRTLPDARIISFEPLAEAFQELTASMKTDANFEAFNFALGEREGGVEMHKNEWTQSSSLLPMAELHKEVFTYTKNETTEEIEIRRLDDVLGGVKLRPEILVKLDTQGYEDKVILGGEEVISQARLLVVETSFQTLYEGQPLFDDIYQLLRARGFNYAGNSYQLLSPLDGTIMQVDAVFIRR
ncbi:MAG TPA: FkbM family methyltransferase [Pyrinomonadaceae bacterium]|nr:FkbM family methyltransferase [Pyrinomonadaceae bacterium]